jgi:ABC-type sugar transport system, ATPase component
MAEPVLELLSVSKSINNIPILQNVSLTLYKGELNVLLGENGAGKSSLVRVLSGIWQKDTGSILIDGKEIKPDSPKTAARYGISVMQQESYIFEHLTVAENIYICNTPKSRLKLRNKRKLNEMAQKLLDDLEFPIKSTQRAGELNLAKRRMVEIARIATLPSGILILDEPTTSISEWESRSLYHLLMDYKRNGGTILYITQSFEHIAEYADRISIMRDGSIVNSIPINAATQDNIEKMIWGQYYPDKYPKLATPKGPELFYVENLSTPNLLQDINFSLSQGEILGIAGLVGSGRSQLAKALFGLQPTTSGDFYVDRLKAQINTPHDAITLGIAYVTEDRSGDGLFMNLSALENTFVFEELLNDSLFIKNRVMSDLYKKYEKRVNLKVPSPRRNLFGLSGGTHQKLLLLRWFLSDAKIFIFDEPTRGIDIASKVDIYNLMNDLVRKKSAIILISSSFDELVGMCDRILVLRDGRISYEAHRNKPNDFDNIYRYAVHNSR